MDEETMQWFFSGLILFGALASAVGGFGSTYVTKKAGERSQAAAKEAAARDKLELQQRLEGDKADLQAELTKLRQSLDQNTSIVFKAMNIKLDTWTKIELKSVPTGGVVDYVMLLFKSDRGRISGKARVEGSETISTFSTTANDSIPVVVPNAWIPAEKRYRNTTTLEFTITEKTDPAATLSILTKGYIDTRGREPH
ncbi:hypothetical protein [Bradyrhizobium sp. AUGA SZCCT0160]|uniref:hypothetical protein n=1 Tax=Bradyrhizobium sp. AUGA SZCCT0160 TaxID=2807662 RepID=UPI001BAD6298|nr:hypothetical protein [Bradyrhizobium sp. AUGA SZCCT0160]MBR1191158.1 hypothetical protein [Bradyrhizobium sp. AUGA SZCCT0160]